MRAKQLGRIWMSAHRNVCHHSASSNEYFARVDSTAPWFLHRIHRPTNARVFTVHCLSIPVARVFIISHLAFRGIAWMNLTALWLSSDGLQRNGPRRILRPTWWARFIHIFFILVYDPSVCLTLRLTILANFSRKIWRVRRSTWGARVSYENGEARTMYEKWPLLQVPVLIKWLHENRLSATFIRNYVGAQCAHSTHNWTTQTDPIMITTTFNWN